MKNILNLVKRDTLNLSNSITSCDRLGYISYHKNLEVNSNLDLEYLYDNDNADGIYVEGDLKVNGNVFSGTCTFLYVGGDLYVDSLFCTADELKIEVKGNVYVKHFLVTNEDTYFVVKGKINSPIRIHSPHHIYIKDQLNNAVCFTEIGFSELWEDIIHDENWDDFIKFKGDNYEYEDETEIELIRENWDFYQAVWKNQNVFPMSILNDIDFDEKIDKKVNSEKILNEVQELIEKIRNTKPTVEFWEEYE